MSDVIPTHESPAVESLIHWTATGVEVAGIAVIVLGAVLATVVFARRWLGAFGFEAAYHEYRSDLGRAILLGLELLVAADIIDTVTVKPSYETVGVLAIIVVIRTFLSWSLEVELEGRWPWQQHRLERRGAQSGSDRAPDESG